MASRIGDLFRSGSDGDEEEDEAEEPELSHYELVVKSGDGGWKIPTNEFRNFSTELDDIDDLDSLVSKDIIEQTAEAEGWPSGEYRLISKAEAGGVIGHEWKLEWENEEGDARREEELTLEERILKQNQEILMELRGGGGGITEPGEARGAVFERALEGDLPANADMEQLGAFLSEWEKSETGPPETPHEAAGQMYAIQLANENTEAAMAVLSDWLQTEDTGGSLMEKVTELDGFEADMETVKTLGMIRFLDDPEAMTSSIASGVLGGAQEGASDGTEGEDTAGIADLLGQAGDEDVDEEAAPEAEADATAEPEQTGADLDVIEEPEESDAEAAQPDVAAESADEGAGDDQTDVSTDEAAETDASATTDDADDSVAEVQNELEEEIDREAGEYPNAADAMERMGEAAEDDEAATNGGGE